MKVLVTGGGGYIGSTLSEMLLDQGFNVTVLDRFFFGEEALKGIADRMRIVRGDVRWVDSSIMNGVDAVIDMAALSNDPASELDPKKTMEINYNGRVRIAKMAKRHGVEKYVLASSCSVYGVAKKGVDEKAPTAPLTTYAKANALWEKATLPLSDRKFSVTAMRQATVFGPSRRMRFDTALNSMTLRLFKNEKMRILRNGKQFITIVHVKDVSRAFIKVLEAGNELVSKQIFNLGSNDQNIRIMDLAKLVARSVGRPFSYEWYGLPDYRNCSVNFSQ